MEWLWSKLKQPLKVLWSYLVALSRLVLWTVLFFFSGLQRTLFMRSEVCSVDFKIIPLRCDMEDADEKLSYIDKLCSANPDLLEAEEEIIDVNDDIPFDDEGDKGEDK